MAIYIVQHGKSLPKAEDPHKGLSTEGVGEVERIAMVAGNYKVPVASIAHSGKYRAEQTARIFARALNPEKGVRVVDGINPMDDVTAFAQTIDLESREMVVGHLPFMERLVAFLITGQSDRPVFRIQNGGIICLDRYPESEQIVIKWALMPTVG